MIVHKQLLFISFLFFPIFLFSGGKITIVNDNIGHSFSKQVLVFEDEQRTVEIDSILKMPDSIFSVMTSENPRVQFANSRFWIKFSITNSSDFIDFFIETARPITDKVIFYRINKANEVVEIIRNGDDYNYYEKAIRHRKNLFSTQIKKGETQHFYVAVISGGEGVLLPLKVHEKMAFFEQDYKDQFKNGFYYGVICLVIVIYFFFYLLLKDRSFLYYILYVFFQGLLQFSLDGYSHHHFFPSSAYIINRFPPFTGAVAILFMLIYVSNFLNLRKNGPKLNGLFKLAGLLIGIALVFIFIPGKLHAISYPMINAFSLVSIMLSVGTIFYLRIKGQAIDIYFTVAFVVLIVGAIVFILGNFGIIQNASISLNALKVCSVIEVVVLSISMSFKYRELQKDKEAAQAIALENLKEKNAIMDQANIRLEEQVIERTSEIESQRSELAYKNKEILSSIEYAKRIQEAILPPTGQIKQLLTDVFVLYAPKDVVSGDFYFVDERSDGSVMFAAVDCTGHGVPGAFMSIVGANYLNQAVSENNLTTPAAVLSFLNTGVTKTIKNNNDGDTIRDGMDMSLCIVNKDRSELQYAGAKNPLYLITPKPVRTELSELVIMENEQFALIQIKGDKHPIGNYADNELESFTNHVIKIEKGDVIYIFTDGYADQFGGDRLKKFNYRRFKSLLLANAALPMLEQQKLLADNFKTWMGSQEQIDDVLVMGVKI